MESKMLKDLTSFRFVVFKHNTSSSIQKAIATELHNFSFLMRNYAILLQLLWCALKTRYTQNLPNFEAFSSFKENEVEPLKNVC